MLVGQSLLHSLCQRTSWGETANHLESASFCMTDRDVDTKTIPRFIGTTNHVLSLVIPC